LTKMEPTRKVILLARLSASSSAAKRSGLRVEAL